MTDKKQIFISHATLDDSLVNDIADKLEASYVTWIDHRHGLTPKDPDWDAALRVAIKNSVAGIFIMTENALASKVCKAECLLLQQLGKPLYVIRAQACKPENIWLTISLIQYADWVTNADKAISDITRALDGEKADDLPTPHYSVTGYGTMTQYLPYLSNPLRGRDADVTALVELLGKGGVTQLIGVGGLGKSRISAEIALAYPHGAVWHRCSSVSNGTEVLALLRSHLGLSDDVPEELVISRMADRKALLVIDNAEDVTSANREGYIALFNQLTHKHVPVLHNSREEWTEQFPYHTYKPAPLTDLNIAIQLTSDFCHSKGKSLTDAQLKQLTQAGRLHPRLIEFAVGQIGNVPYEDVIRRLNELKHKSIQKALDEMITKTLEQMKTTDDDGANADALIRNLTWLQATFPEAIIDALKPASITTRDDLLDALATLKRYQFIRQGEDGRYSLAELVREALGTPKDPAVFNIYADFYTARASEIFRDTPVQDWDDKEGGQNADDIINIKALGDALHAQTANGTTGDLERVVAFAYATTRYVNKRMEAKAWGWLQMGIHAVRALQKEAPEVLTLKKRLVLFLNEMGGVYDALGQKDKALAYYEQALPISREVGDRRGEAVTCFNIGMIYDALGDLDKAIEYLKRCVMLDEQVKHPDLESDRRVLMALKRKRGDADVPEEASPEEQFNALVAKLAGIYKQVGEAGLRQMLTENNVPEAQIDGIVSVVIAKIAEDAGGA